MIHMDEIIRQLGSNAVAIRALVETISTAQAQWKPDAETWSMQDVMEHVYNEERIDFRQHLREMFNDPPKPWGRFDPGAYVTIENCHQGLSGFLTERQTSLAWLAALPVVDWDQTIEAVFGPEDEKLIFRAGDVLLSWVEHDFLHLRQMIELHHAWNEHQAPPYSLQYAGGWQR